LATPAQAIFRTDVFACENQRGFTTSGSEQSAEVFARRERRSPATTLAEVMRFTVRLSIDGDPVGFTYTSFDGSLPQWATSAFQSLSERWGARPGWDGYHAEPTKPQLVVNLLNVLSDLMQPNYLPPQIMPLADGGVQAEWHSSAKDLEVVVSALEQPTYYYFDRQSGTEEDSEIEPNYAHVQQLIGQLS
jgi:hypothetical protein